MAAGLKAFWLKAPKFKSISFQGSKVFWVKAQRLFFLCLPRLKRPKNILGKGSKGSEVLAEVLAEVLVEVLAEVPVEVLSEVPTEMPAEVLVELPAEVAPEEKNNTKAKKTKRHTNTTQKQSQRKNNYDAK